MNVNRPDYKRPTRVKDNTSVCQRNATPASLGEKKIGVIADVQIAWCVRALLIFVRATERIAKLCG